MGRREAARLLGGAEGAECSKNFLVLLAFEGGAFGWQHPQALPAPEGGLQVLLASKGGPRAPVVYALLAQQLAVKDVAEGAVAQVVRGACRGGPSASV